MKTITVILLLTIASAQVEARSGGVSLNEAVNQVKSEGRVLSAKTINGRHEIKILTPSGTVKTINKKASNSQVKTKPSRPDYYNNGGQSMRDRKQNKVIPNRFNNQQKTMKLNARQLDRKRSTSTRNTTNKNNSRQSTNKKDK